MRIEISLSPRRGMDPPDVNALVRRTIEGDEAAWQELWQAVEPKLYATLRRPNLLGRLSQSEDDCRNIVVDVMSRLRADGFARLGQYAAAQQSNPALPFMAWLVVVAKRVAVDYLRGHETYIDRRHVVDASSPGKWRDVVTLPPDSQIPDGRPPAITGLGTAHELMAFAADLPDDQRTALTAWLEGASFGDIGKDGDAKDGERRVRAALERIRRKFR